MVDGIAVLTSMAAPPVLKDVPAFMELLSHYVTLLICPGDVGMTAEEPVDERRGNPWLWGRVQPSVRVAL